MTEEEWQECSDWVSLFEFLDGRVTERKLRLFAVACCRAIWSSLHEDSRRAVEVVEHYADRLASKQDLQAVRDWFRATDANQTVLILRGVRYRPDIALATADDIPIRAARSAMHQSAEAVTKSTLQSDSRDYTASDYLAVLRDALVRRRHLLHDVLGPLPFCTPAISPAWPTSDVLTLATVIYAERAFDRMPILADALEEAGCTDAAILDHCRAPGPHVRGCWVVDALLGKA